MATEGKVTRKAHSKGLSRSGLKSTGRDSDKELRHRPLYNEKDKYEYYTTEDEFGLPINKLRKKGSKPRGKKSPEKVKKKKVPARNSDEDLEFYTTNDKNGERV